MAPRDMPCDALGVAAETACEVYRKAPLGGHGHHAATVTSFTVTWRLSAIIIDENDRILRFGRFIDTAAGAWRWAPDGLGKEDL